MRKLDEFKFETDWNTLPEVMSWDEYAFKKGKMRRRELLLEKIDQLKEIMPWYVLEYYQSKLSVPYSFTTLYEYLKEYRRFFEWLQDSDLVSVERIADIPLDVLEHLTKKDMEAFILYLRERPLMNANTSQNGVSQTTINRNLVYVSRKL